MKVRQGAALIILGTVGLILGACAGPAPEPPPRRVGEIKSEQAGEIVSVRDVMIDPAAGPQMRVGVPLSSPLGIMRVPVKVPLRPSPRDIPGEELVVRLDGGGIIQLVQERNDPPFAMGERVRVLHERENVLTGIAKTRIERAD